MAHKLIKDDKISLAFKPYVPVESQYTLEELGQMKNTIDEATDLQKSLGLGVPNPSKIKAAITKMERYQLVDKILALNPKQYTLVSLEDDKVLPRFKYRGANTARKIAVEIGNRVFSKPPEVVMVELGPGISKIRCNGSSRMSSAYEADIPSIPMEGLKRVQQVRQVDESLDIHLVYLPSWKAIPQLDPVLLVECGNQFIKIYEWGGDLDLVNSLISPID